MPAGDDDRKYIDAFENENTAYRPGNKVLVEGRPSHDHAPFIITSLLILLTKQKRQHERDFTAHGERRWWRGCAGRSC
jgi:hypothetical protein